MHSKAGLPDEKIVELHGSNRKVICLQCDREFDPDEIIKQLVGDFASPKCDVCGGILKSATVSFGQAMPENAMRVAQEWTEQAEVFIVMGSSLLTLFLNHGTIQLGFWTIFIAHVMFIISFVVVTVKARLIGFDRHLEEAAMDLGANEWTTFQKVTLPLLAPAIIAAALLGFALSIDDFVITYLNAGPVQTFPIFVWGVARVAVPPQVNVVASAIFLVAIGLGLANVVWQYRAAKSTRGGT